VNKNFWIILITLMTGNAVYSAPVNNVLLKFSYAMVGVIISALVIYAAIFLFSKSERFKLQYRDESFAEPKTKDEAIKLYIRKNKIK